MVSCILEETPADLKMGKYIFCLIGMLGLLLASPLCYAEKIYVKGGRITEGEIISRDKRSVWVKQGSADTVGAIGISIDDIEKIENADGSISKYDYKSLYEKSQDCIKHKEYKEAVRLYGLLLESFPESVHIHHLRALLNHRIGDLPEAAEDYKFCIEHGISDVKIYNNLGVIYAKRKEYQEAIDCFSKATEERPDMVESHNNLAEVFMRTQDYNRAISEYEKVIKAEPDNADARYNLGLAYMKEGNYPKAREEWERALAIRPEDENTRDALRYIEMKMEAEKIKNLNQED